MVRLTAISEGLVYIHAKNAHGTFDESIPVRVVPGDTDGMRLAVYLKVGEKTKLSKKGIPLMAADYGRGLYKEYELLLTEHEAVKAECKLLQKEHCLLQKERKLKEAL